MVITLISAFNAGAIILTGTMWIIIISYSVRKLPYTMRSSVGILYQIERSVEEASISLGVPPMKTFFKTTVVLMLPGVLSGAGAELHQLHQRTVFHAGAVHGQGPAPSPWPSSNAVTNDAYGQASALATILTVTTIIALLIFNKVSHGKSVV